MRNEDVKNEHNLLRVLGIDPEDILLDHVEDSFSPGEKHFHDDDEETDHHHHGGDDEEEASFDFVDCMIFSQ